MEPYITQYLLCNGIKPHYKGFQYLVDILLKTTSTDERIPMGKLYKDIGEKHGVTPQCVERSLRTLIGAYWRDSKGEPYKPTNSEYIARVTAILKLSK